MTATNRKNLPSMWMDFEEPEPRVFLKILAAVIVILFILAGISALRLLADYPVYQHSYKLIGLCAILLAVVITLVAVVFNGRATIRLLNILSTPKNKPVRFGLALAFILLIFLFILTNQEYAPLLRNFWIRVFLFALSCLIAWGLLLGSYPQKAVTSFLIPIVWLGVLWTLMLSLPWNPGNPFSRDWTETSWYYYASFFFSQKIYGVQFAWPFLDIGRPLFLSLIFLLPNTSLTAMRVWQSILWLGSALLLAWLLIRRVDLRGNTKKWLLLGWLFSWILMGPVYFHLTLIAALVVGFFRKNRLWRSALWIALASILGGIFRFNWIVVPSMIAIALYILETSYQAANGFWRYYLHPILWSFIGVGAGLVGLYAYVVFSGREQTHLVTKFSSPYLWYRLLPNSNMSLGILPGIIFVSVALGVCIILVFRFRKIHLSRWFPLTLILAVLWIGGSVASTKIGGGFNLHNLDAFIVLFLITGVYSLAGSVEPDGEPKSIPHSVWGLIILVIATPVVWFSLVSGGLNLRPDINSSSQLQELKSVLAPYSKKSSEVLFLSARHLLTFHMLEGIKLVPDYELQELIEMAISGNADYFLKFDSDLKAHRFALIVTRKINPDFRDPSRPSAEEINAWNHWVTTPILENYHSILTLNTTGSGLDVFAPNL